jgi:uncharacterized protein YecT (DUF1311 family)
MREAAVHRWIVPIAVGLALVAVPAGAGDNDPTPEDERVFSSCLANADERGLPAIDCAGTASDLCMEAPDGYTTPGMIGCLHRELQLWDAMLNDRYGRLMEVLEPEETTALRSAQRAWIASRDAACAFESMTWQGGTGGGPAGTGCLMRETAWRAIFLDGIVAFRATEAP